MAPLRKSPRVRVFLRHHRISRQLRAVPRGSLGQCLLGNPTAGSGFSGVCWGQLAEKAFAHLGHRTVALLCGFFGVYCMVVPLGSLLTHSLTSCPMVVAVALGGRRSFSQTQGAHGHAWSSPAGSFPPSSSSTPGHHSMCCPTFPQHRDHLRALGGLTCLSCHFHLVLRRHRDALYISLILKYHLLHPESN